MKLKYPFLLFLACIAILNLQAKEKKFPIDRIPDQLKRNAQAVVRECQHKLYINPDGSLQEEVYMAISILNSNGLHLANKIIYYDRFSSVKKIKAVIYDARGNQVKKISGSDIIDHSAISSGTIYSDGRIKHIDPKYQNTPFTIEYSYKKKYDSYLSYPSWNPIPDYHCGVEHSKFEVFHSGNQALRYHLLNYPQEPKKEKQKDYQHYTWEMSNQKLLLPELYSASSSSIFPQVLVAPTNFIMEGFAGSMESWKKFGLWNYQLLQGQDVLTEAMKNKVHELIATCNNDSEKAEVLYQYMQNKTRYISVQIGIGGWQPSSAAAVDRLCYGDCKALSNYMMSLLKEAGIESYYALVRAGRNQADILEVFPSNQFNHAILCLPLDGDTTWLECTSQTKPFGCTGSFTDNRKALLISSEGGKLVNTPSFNLENNSTFQKVDIEFQEDLSALSHWVAEYQGISYEKMRYRLFSDKSQTRNELLKTTPLVKFDLINYETEIKPGQSPLLNLTKEIIIKDYCTKVHDKILMPFYFNDGSFTIPTTLRERQNDILIRRSVINVDSISYSFPETFELVELPEDVEINSKFGHYHFSYSIKDNKLLVSRELIFNKGLYPPEEINEFISFLEQIERTDNKKSAWTIKE